MARPRAACYGLLVRAAWRVGPKVAWIVVAACSTKDPAPGAGAGPGAAAADAASPGDPSPTPIVEDPESACPAPYVSAAPKEGQNEGFEAAGQSRSFHLLLPPASFTGPRPILFAFHGTSEKGARFVTRAKLAEFVARGFVVVAPDAAGNGTFWPVWDGMRAPGKEADPNPDLVLFDRLLSCTAAHFAIDQRRVYAVGHSAGGIFMNRLLRSRSKVLAGGIVGSGVFSLTSTGTSGPLEPLLAIVTWGGDNDTYRGTTPNGVSVPYFSFVEQASLASRFYEAEPNVGHVRCRGDDLGHAWLPLNDWFADLLLAHPKGASTDATLAPLPAGAPVACSVEPYVLPPLPDMTCGSTARAGCREACQLFADCAVENRTVGPSLASQLSEIGFTTTSCAGCVSRCQSGATTATDAQVLSCFQARQAAATCGPGIEGASPLFEAVNACCDGKSGSNLCVSLCTTLWKSSASRPFFPACQALAN